MADEKVTNQKLVKLRRDTALFDLALAASYPQTHTRNVARPTRTNNAAPLTREVGWFHLSVTPEDRQPHNVVNDHPIDRLRAAAGPLTPVATPRDARSSQEKSGDNSDVPLSVAKPWKRPWDK